MARPGTLFCSSCRKQYALDTRDWLCGCGGLFELDPQPNLAASSVDRSRRGLWRYHKLFPLDPDWEPITLGEGNTPLVRVDWEGIEVHFKLESLSPTGSFKDRGAATLVTALLGLGVSRVVEDSSGNAGVSLAAYATHAGIACEVCVPSTAAGPKLSQMATYGAEVIEIRGRREYAALAAWAAAAHGAYYASHVYNPFFLPGIETLAFELWEELGYRAPHLMVVPVGNGTLLLGLYRGFRRLCEARVIDRLPVIVAVQAGLCAPLHAEFQSGGSTGIAEGASVTAATGIAIRQPVRKAQILDAVRATGGTVVTVSEEQIEMACRLLARRGFHVEPTSAVAVAALSGLGDMLTEPGEIIVPLTGHGLKSPP